MNDAMSNAMNFKTCTEALLRLTELSYTDVDSKALYNDLKEAFDMLRYDVMGIEDSEEEELEDEMSEEDKDYEGL